MQFSDDKMQPILEKANSVARQLISLAENMFGPMHSVWTYDGVKFYDHPPHLHYFPHSATVQIWLSMRAVDNVLERDFQLAHEVCHLLYPSASLADPGDSQTNVLNEGISTYFSVMAVGLLHGEDAAIAILESLAANSPRYFFSYQHVSALMQIDLGAIKKIREIQPMINDVTGSNLRQSGIEIPDEAIDALVEIF